MNGGIIIPALENKAIVRRWIEEGWNQGNVGVADEIFAPEFEAQDIDRVLHGPEDMKKSVKAVRSAFPDIQFTIEHIIAEGDMVVGAFGVRGTHTGGLMGIPATGNQVVFTAVDVWEFRGGMIVKRHLALFDQLCLLQQLGVLPRSLGQR